MSWLFINVSFSAINTYSQEGKNYDWDDLYEYQRVK